MEGQPKRASGAKPRSSGAARKFSNCLPGHTHLPVQSTAKRPTHLKSGPNGGRGQAVKELVIGPSRCLPLTAHPSTRHSHSPAHSHQENPYCLRCLLLCPARLALLFFPSLSYCTHLPPVHSTFCCYHCLVLSQVRLARYLGLILFSGVEAAPPCFVCVITWSKIPP